MARLRCGTAPPQVAPTNQSGTPVLQRSINRLEHATESNATEYYRTVWEAFIETQGLEFGGAIDSLLSKNCIALVRLEATRSLPDKTITELNAITNPSKCPWGLTFCELYGIFGESIKSARLLKNLRELARICDDFLLAYNTLNDIRRRRWNHELPKSGVSHTEDWRPYDVTLAMKQLSIPSPQQAPSNAARTPASHVSTVRTQTMLAEDLDGSPQSIEKGRKQAHSLPERFSLSEYPASMFSDDTPSSEAEPAPKRRRMSRPSTFEFSYVRVNNTKDGSRGTNQLGVRPSYEASSRSRLLNTEESPCSGRNREAESDQLPIADTYLDSDDDVGSEGGSRHVDDASDTALVVDTGSGNSSPLTPAQRDKSPRITTPSRTKLPAAATASVSTNDRHLQSGQTEQSLSPAHITSMQKEDCIRDQEDDALQSMQQIVTLNSENETEMPKSGKEEREELREEPNMACGEVRTAESKAASPTRATQDTASILQDQPCLQDVKTSSALPSTSVPVDEPGIIQQASVEAETCQAQGGPFSLEAAVRSLHPGEWLNETALELIFKSLAPSESRFHIVETGWVSPDISAPPLRRYRPNLSDVDTIIVPLCHKQQHWSVGIIYLNAGRLEVYDPMNKQSTIEASIRAVRAFAQGINDQHGWEARTSETSLSQHDTSSCGVYVAAFVLCRMFGFPVPGSISPDLWRRSFAAALSADPSLPRCWPIPYPDRQSTASAAHESRAASNNDIDAMDEMPSISLAKIDNLKAQIRLTRAMVKEAEFIKTFFTPKHDTEAIASALSNAESLSKLVPTLPQPPDMSTLQDQLKAYRCHLERIKETQIMHSRVSEEMDATIERLEGFVKDCDHQRLAVGDRLRALTSRILARLDTSSME